MQNEQSDSEAEGGGGKIGKYRRETNDGPRPRGINHVDIELFARRWDPSFFRRYDWQPAAHLPPPTCLAVDQMNISGTLETELITIVLRAPPCPRPQTKHRKPCESNGNLYPLTSPFDW